MVIWLFSIRFGGCASGRIHTQELDYIIEEKGGGFREVNYINVAWVCFE